MKTARAFYLVNTDGQKKKVTRREIAQAAATSVYAIDHLSTNMLAKNEHIQKVGNTTFEVYEVNAIPEDMKPKQVISSAKRVAPASYKASKADLRETEDGKFIIW